MSTDTQPALTYSLRYPAELTLASILPTDDGHARITGLGMLGSGHVAIHLDGDAKPTWTVPGNELIEVEHLASRPSDAAIAAQIVLDRQIEALAAKEAAEDAPTRELALPDTDELELPAQTGVRHFVLPNGNAVHTVVESAQTRIGYNELISECRLVRPMALWKDPEDHPEPEKLHDCTRCNR